MKRIDSVNARPDENGLGKAGFNDNADLPGQDATYVTPGWFNTVQEELCNLLELRGIALSPDSKRQLYDLLTTQTDLEALAAVIEEAFIRKSEIIDNLTTNDAKKPVSAKQAKNLQDNKLDKTANAVSSSKLKVPRKINNVDFDGTSDITVTDDALTYMPIPYPKSSPPSGYLAMMGQAISESTYPKLYALYGAVLPDMRSQFLRGLDYGKGIDEGRIVLSLQEDMLKSHNHGIPPSNAVPGVGIGFQGSNFQFINNKTTDYTGGTETRPKNIAFLYIVKAG